VIGGAQGRQVLESGINVTLPQIRRFENMHVAVENFEAIFGHNASGF
jgi:hypothetical protein